MLEGMTAYIGLYIEVNAIGIALALMIIVKISSERDNQVSAKAFMRVALAILAILLLDCLWVMVDGRSGDFVRIANILVNCAYMFCTGLISYLWLRYTLYKLNAQKLLSRGISLLLAVPLFVLFLICATNPFSGLLFRVTEQNEYIRGSAQVIQNICCYFYIIFATVCNLVIAASLKGEARSEALTLSTFGVLPMLGGIINIATGLPTTWVFAVMSLLRIYMKLQTHQISTDSLTGLNNRRSFDKYLLMRLTERGRNGLLHLLIVDIDDFKTINDTFGHLIGDEALKQTSTLLRTVCAPRQAFMARYGGDEFAVILESPSAEEPEKLLCELNEAFSRFNEGRGERYRLKLSIGTAVCGAEKTTAEELIGRADTELYEIKAQKKQR